LTDNLLKQIEPFGATFHYGQTVAELQRRGDGRFDLTTDKGTRFIAKTVFIAAGAGAFEPRALAIEGIAKFRDTQLFYSVRKPAELAGRHLVILGGGDSALDWALNFAQDGANKAASVTLVHRRDGFKAAPASIAKMRELCDANRMRFIVGQATAFDESDGRLTRVKITAPDNTVHDVGADALLVFFGLSPRLGPVANWGLDIERRQLKVDTEKFSTSEPGIFAVGDINTYPGKKKLILSGFHECALAAFGAAPIVLGKPIHLQYTTTSTKLHKVLGVETPTFD
jgi:thioredoxin reductase (NADPH)